MRRVAAYLIGRMVSMAKVFAVNGSPRHKGNTAGMINTVLDVCKASGHEVEMFQAGGLAVRGCMACGSCRKVQDKPPRQATPATPPREGNSMLPKVRCVIDDWVNGVYEKMVEADVIILGSPSYFCSLTPEMKAVIDRCGFLARSGGNSALSRKIGAAVSVSRRAGEIYVLDSMNHFFQINDMVMPGSTYWNMSHALGVGDYEADVEGVKTMTRLGENIVWLLERLK